MIKVEMITCTPDADKLVAAAAKLCYAKSDIDTLWENLTPEKTEDFLDLLMSLGHQSPIEHASFTFGIEGVSRACLAQITRHRIASFSVQSQRYVNKAQFEYIIPPEIAAIPEALEEFVTAMDEDLKHYNNLHKILAEAHYKKFIENGMSEKDAKKAADKKANEDARFVLPNACDTRMIVTMNTRSLYNFFALRCCDRAQWEIREVSRQMLLLCKQTYPLLFKKAGPPCVSKGKCSEGAYTCGKAAEMKKIYGDHV